METVASRSSALSTFQGSVPVLPLQQACTWPWFPGRAALRAHFLIFIGNPYHVPAKPEHTVYPSSYTLETFLTATVSENRKIILHLPGFIKVKWNKPRCFSNPSHSSEQKTWLCTNMTKNLSISLNGVAVTKAKQHRAEFNSSSVAVLMEWNYKNKESRRTAL